MDNADRAQLREEQERDHAIAMAARHAIEAPMRDEAGARICIDCEIRIPHARLLAAPGSVRCVGCQEVHERRNQ